jgi:hypothetical protein
MSDLSLNQQVIAEFRANGGRVGGYLEGAVPCQNAAQGLTWCFSLGA